MKAQQYREMSSDELQMKLDDLQKHLFDLRSQAVTEKLENSKAIKNTKRDIARIKTIISQQKLPARKRKCRKVK
ncbi:MAG: 50S ribosomal protein L29 [Planctomycetota bacterium]|jgi:large subunit ribosomal protein L29